MSTGEEGTGNPASPEPPAVEPARKNALASFATKLEDTVTTRSRQLEEKMVEAAEGVVSRTEPNLRSMAGNLEEKTRSEFAEKMGAIEKRSKIFEENLVKAADEVVARAEASLQGVATSLGEKAKNDLAERVGTIEKRLQESVTQIEAVLPKLQDVSRYGSEIEKARQNIEQLSSSAVEFALEELSQLIEREIRPVASNLGVRAREYVAQESTAALQEFLQSEGADRLHKWFEEAQQAQAPAIQAKVRENIEFSQRTSVEKLKAQLESMVVESSEKVRRQSEEAVARSLETMNKRLDEAEKTLNTKADQAVERLNDLLAKVTSNAETVSVMLQKQADEIEHFQARTRERFVNETAAALRDKIGKMLVALQQSCQEIDYRPAP